MKASIRSKLVLTLITLVLLAGAIVVPLTISHGRSHAASADTSVTVQVPSTVQWVNTGITLNAGDNLQITATGSWSPAPSFGTWGPDGSTQLWQDNFLNLQDIGVCAFCATTPTPHFAALIGYIGDNPPAAGSYTSTSILPEAQKVFFVGSNFNSTAPLAGTLWLNFNDDAYSDYTIDNSGQVTATITTNSAITTPTPQPSTCIQSLQATTNNTTMSQQYYINATVYNPATIPQSVTVRLNELGARADYYDTPSAAETKSISSLAPGSTQTLTFGPYSHYWSWLLPIEKQGTVGTIDRFMGKTFVLKQINGLFDTITTSGTAVFNDVATLVSAFKDASEALPSVQYTYSYDLPSCGAPSSTNVTVNVPSYKLDLLNGSWTFDWLAGKSTTYGIYAGLTGVGAPATLFGLDSQIALKDLAIGMLQAAEDPDPNYTQIVQSSPVAIPNTQSLTGQDAEAFVHLANAIGDIQAAGKSLAKSDGAATAGDHRWEVIQLRSARDFLTQTLYELNAFLANANSFKVAQAKYTSTPGAESQVVNSLQQNGLPAIEVNGLTQIGYSSQDIADALNVQLTMMPVFQGNYASADPSVDLYPPLENLLSEVRTELSTASGTRHGNAIDVVPPISQIALNGILGTNNWYTSPVQISINATDNPGGSGVKAIEYSLDNGQTWLPYSAPFTVSNDGIYTVLSRATDQEGNVEFPPQHQDFKIDQTPPTVSCTVNPNTLWPPDHKLIPVTATVNVTDVLSGPAGFTLTSVTSNEPDNGLGDGDQPNDIQGFTIGTASTSGHLRAERSGSGTGRIYTLTYQGLDNAGNSASCSATVTVPHDQNH